jgi:hypothetical protein
MNSLNFLLFIEVEHSGGNFSESSLIFIDSYIIDDNVFRDKNLDIFITSTKYFSNELFFLLIFGVK